MGSSGSALKRKAGGDRARQLLRKSTGSKKSETHWKPPTDGETASLGIRVRPAPEQPTSYNKRVAAFAHFVRSREHGSESRAGNAWTLREEPVGAVLKSYAVERLMPGTSVGPADRIGAL